MDLYFYSAFQGYGPATCHTHIHTLLAEAAMQFGVQYLAQGHFNLLMGELGIRTSDLTSAR